MAKKEAAKEVSGSILAKMIVEAKTPAARSAVTRRVNKYVAEREADGKDPKMVRAGIQSWVTRYSSK